MESKTSPQKKIFLFLILTLAFSSIFYALIISAGSLDAAGGLYTLGLMWSPGLAGIITLRATEHSLRSIGWKWGKTRHQLWAIAIPFLYTLVTYAIIWLAGLGALNTDLLNSFALRYQIQTLPLWIYILSLVGSGLMLAVASCLSALGEEIGWRGVLVPQLARVTSFTKTALISGAVWAVWHLPLLLFADYNNGTPRWFSLLCFVILVLGISFVYTWLRLKSGSLWVAMFLHASHNLFVQRVFTPLTLNTGSSAYWIDEFGIGLAVAALIVALIFWLKRKEIEQPENSS